MFSSKPEIIKELEDTFGTKLNKEEISNIWKNKSYSKYIRGQAGRISF